MDSLLRWSLENSSSSNDGGHTVPAPRKDLDPAIIDHILGRPDSELMKEALKKAMDEEISEDERIAALDDIEMLVENIDNANDLSKLKMWDPLQKLLTSPTSTEDIKVQAMWVIGTAVQNNPAAQNAYLSLDPLSVILSFLLPSVKSVQLRSKAVYALSGLLKLNATAVSQLDHAGGWDVLRSALEDSNISVRRKTAFLLNTLLVPVNVPSHRLSPSSSGSNPSRAHAGASTSATLHAPETPNAPVHPNSHASMLSNPMSVATAPATLRALHEHNILPALIRELTSPTPYGADEEREGDVDFEEKVIRLLHTYVTSHQGEFSKEEKEAL
ncbi:hypothetical protein HETIRDRAFT_246122, partial [Heterobasidion irregulare TC 32-1]